MTNTTYSPTKPLSRLTKGDVIAAGPYAGDWHNGTRCVEWARPASARGYTVVRFSDGTTTSGRSDTPCTVEPPPAAMIDGFDDGRAGRMSCADLYPAEVRELYRRGYVRGELDAEEAAGELPL